MDGCMFLNKGPTKMCLAKQNKKDGWGGGGGGGGGGERFCNET